jgi:hypothetical protein
MQYISFMYSEFRPILLLELKIQNAFKSAKMGMWHVCRHLTKNLLNFWQ